MNVSTQEEPWLQPWQFFLLGGMLAATATVIVATGQSPANIIILSLTVVSVSFVGLGAYRMLLPLVTKDLEQPPMIAGRTRAALEREKTLVLRSIKELEFDHRTGKISDVDYRELVGPLRRHVAEALQAHKDLKAKGLSLRVVSIDYLIAGDGLATDLELAGVRFLVEQRRHALVPVVADAVAPVAQAQHAHAVRLAGVGKVEALYKELYSSGQPNAPLLRRLFSWIVGRGFDTAPAAGSTPKVSLLDRIVSGYTRFRAPFSERRLLLGLGDAASMLVAQAVTVWLSSISSYWQVDVALYELAILPGILAVWLAIAWLNDLYHIPSSYVKTRTARRIIQTTARCMLIYTGIFYICPRVLPLQYYLVVTLLMMPIVAAWRVFYTIVFKRDVFQQRGRHQFVVQHHVEAVVRMEAPASVDLSPGCLLATHQ